MSHLDPITMEVIHNALSTITEEMGVALSKSAYSTNIKTRLDFSCAIYDYSLRCITQASHQPAHLGTLYHLVPNMIKEYGIENLSPGDGILVNDPYRGGSHLPDVTLLSPVFIGSDVFCFVVNMAHHQDIGGGAPGSVPGNSTEIYQEGLIIPGVKFVEKGRIIENVFKLILANVRGAEERSGDYRAQVAANNLGAKRLKELVNKYGVETLKKYMDGILNYTENRFKSNIGNIPEGSYKGEDYLDDDGVTDKPIRVAVEITVKDGELFIDFSQSDKQSRGPMNGTLSCTYSASAYILKCIIDPEIPVNSGFYRPLHIVAPKGSVVNPKPPAAIAGIWEVGQRICDSITKALSQVLPGRVAAAGKGTICNISFGGVNPRTGKVYAFYETVAGGYGARPMKDGVDAVQYHLQNTENAPIEELEMNIPVMITRYELITDSEGAGKYRGGLGLRRDYCFHDHTATFSVVADREKFAPWGLFGGLEGRKAKFTLNPDSTNPVRIKSTATVKCNPGDIVSVQTPGGGGYGDPLRRDPGKVLDDVRNEKISLKRAKSIYGVVIDPHSLEVDYKATEKLRETLREKRERC